MPGPAPYTVGPSGDYLQPQDALDQLLEDLGSTPFAAGQTVSFVDSGVYDAYEVPAALSPQSGAGLLVTAEDGVSARIAGGARAAGVTVGCSHVRIDRQTVAGYVRGVHVLPGANRPVLSRLSVADCLASGILIQEADDAYVVGTVVNGVAYGVVMLDSDNALLLGNTIQIRKLPDVVGRPARAGVFVRMSDDAAARTFIHDTNIVARGGFCIAVTPKSASRLVSDWNNLYSTGKGVGRVIEVGSGAAYRTLADWRARTGQDAHSVSEIPLFVAGDPRPVSEPTVFDLRLMEGSPLTARGIDPSELSLPSQADLTIYATDPDGRTRRDPPAIGAFGLAASPWEFTSPFPETGELSPYGDDLAAMVDAAGKSYRALVDPWYPKIRSGNFFVRDEGYYLFATKKAKRLGDLAWSVFDLSSEFRSENLGIQVDGTEIPDASFRLRGKKLYVRHEGLDVADDSVVVLTGETLSWDTGEMGFSAVAIAETGEFATAARRYFLDPAPAPDAPVVVTDDLVGPLEDEGHLPFGYDVGRDEELGMAELLLPVTNLLRNPTLTYADASAPRGYETTGTVEVLSAVRASADSVHPRMGKGYARVAAGSLSQKVKAGPGDYDARIWLFPWASEETVAFGVRTLDALGNPIDDDTGEWSMPAFGYISLSFEATGEVDSLEIWVAATGEIGVEAMQLEPFPSGKFNRLPEPDDMTVEWESSRTGVHEIDTLNVNPVTDAGAGGFLVVRPVRAAQIDTGEADGKTTLSDDWIGGRLGTLPWAKTTGKGKWRPLLREEAAPLPVTVSLSDPIQVPAAAFVRPDPVVVLQGGAPAAIAVEAVDTEGNPYDFEPLSIALEHAGDDTGEYLGSLARRQYGFWTQLGSSLTCRTDRKGAVSLLLYPPAAGLFELQDPAVLTDGDRYVVTPWPLSTVRHANSTIVDEYGDPVPLLGDPATGELTGELSGGFYRADVGAWPDDSGVTAFADGNRLARTWSPSPGTNEFLLDGKEVVSRHETLSFVYRPRLVYTTPDEPNRIWFRDELVLPDHFLVAYDAVARLRVTGAGAETGEIDETAEVLYRHAREEI